VKLFNFVLLLTLSFSVKANNLELFSPQLLCQKNNGSKAYEYYAGVYIKNVYNDKITVVTEISKPFVSTRADKVIGVYLSTSNVISINDILLIPSVVDFKLVTLKPGEATYVGRKFESNYLFDCADLFYSISDSFSERFGYWDGVASIENVKVKHYEKCSA